MATEKKPSIYDDRGTIGSSDELDEYGVWVKSEPQDLSSARPADQEFAEPSIPDIEELPDFDAGFDTETGGAENDDSGGFSFEDEVPLEDSQDDSFEFVDEDLDIPDMTVSESSPDTPEDSPDTFESPPDSTENSPNTSEESIFAEVSLEDIMASDTTEKPGLSPDSPNEQDTAEGEFSDVSLDEFSDVSLNDLSDVSVDDFLDTDSAGSPGPEAASFEEEGPEQAAPNAAENYGEIHSMVTSASDDEIFISDFDDVEAVSQDIQRSQSAPRPTEPDLSTQLLMKIAEELSSIKGELSGLKSKLAVIRSEEPAEAAPDEQGGGRGFFDEEDDEKIALTGDELDNILNTADFTEEAGADAGESLTDDFSALGGEEDFSTEPFPGLEEVPPGLPEGLPEEMPDMLSDQPDIIGGEVPVESEEADISGEAQEEAVFEENIVLNEPDLDELTGEHSIDVSSEAMLGNDSFDSQEFDVSFEPALEEETDELASSDAAPEEEAGLLETDFEDVNVDDITLDQDVISLDFIEDDLSDIGGDAGSEETLKAKDAEELEILRTEGVKPMTEAPEDTSYLEEDPLATEQLDLSGAVIDEPDLSGSITENPLEEPSLENISIDLDLEEPETVIEEEAPIEEISIDLDLEEPEVVIEEKAPIEEIAIDLDLEEPADTPPDDEIDFESIAEEEELEPEEESFAQVIPEGFVVEPDDSQSASPFDTVDTGESFREEDLDVLEGDTEADELSPPAVEKGAEDAVVSSIPSNIKDELKTVLSYMDQLLESLPEEKIEEFAKSEYFETYKKLFEELGLV
jgi:hypothetical protein